MNLPVPQFQAIQEPDAFLSLFPHRFDFIYAEHPDPGDRPDWKTEDRHPLSDRLIQEGAYLYGVRFGKQTDYLMLAIDPGDFYHPHRDRLVTCGGRFGLCRSGFQPPSPKRRMRPSPLLIPITEAVYRQP